MPERLPGTPLFDALSNHVMVHGGRDRHDLLIGIQRASKVIESAEELLKQTARSEAWHDAADVLAQRLRRLDEWKTE